MCAFLFTNTTEFLKNNTIMKYLIDMYSFVNIYLVNNYTENKNHSEKGKLYTNIIKHVYCLLFRKDFMI